MRKHLKVSLLMLGACVAPNAQANNVYGHTFFSVRPQWQSPMPEKITMFRMGDLALARECGWGGAFQVAGFGGQSTDSKKLGRYFAPTDSNVLLVNSATTGVTGLNCDRAINPANFNILRLTGSTPVAFSSTISFRPKQTVYGAGFEWNQYLGWWNDCCERKWWFDISFPVEHVVNDMRFLEVDATTDGTPCGNANANMTQAFCGTQPLVSFAGGTAVTCSDVTGAGVMAFGKICGKRKHTGVADIELKLGYDYVNCETHHLSGYIGGVFPTGNRPKGEWVFEAIVGNNKHFGILTGGLWGFEVWSGCSNNALRFELEVNSRYLFPRTETRSFDLKNRPWSRYMLVYTSADNAAAGVADWGINHFTRDFRIKPHFQHSFNLGLVYNHCAFEGEIGYNFWARQGETARLRSELEPGLAIAAVNATGVATGLVDLVNGIAVVDPAANVTFTDAETAGCLIGLNDIDYNSVAHPACMTHIVYGSLGYHWDWCWPVFVGVGGSYEFSTFNTALNRWLAWGKFGFSF